MPGKVLITGATGYVGGWVTEALLSNGYEVTALGRRKYPSEKVTSLIVDIANREGVDQAINGQSFDIVVHLAASGERQGDATLDEINTGGTIKLMKALHSNPPKTFIYLSSIKVYNSLSGVVNEASYAEGIGSYGYTKQRAERWALSHCHGWGSRVVVLRLSNAYGAPKHVAVNAWKLLFNDLCRSAYETGEITLKSPPDTPLDMIWLGSVADVIFGVIANKEVSEVYNLGAGKSIAIGEVAKAVAAAYQSYFGRDLTINMPEPSGNSPDFTFDCSKLQSLIKYDTDPHFEEEAIKSFKLLEANA